MLKYLDAKVTFQEFPDEISLCINISNCQFHCKGCHSPELWLDKGTELTTLELDKLIKSNKGITLVGFMGGLPNDVSSLSNIVKNQYNLKTGWYTGLKDIPYGLPLENFDYIKVGPYVEELGGLDCPTTNQRMYKIEGCNILDITNKFWK